MKTTVIAHFYNEAYLLPWWLEHHLPMFDHGILIDYASTDRSVAICREMAPNWEVRPSRNESFTGVTCDAEVMDIERGCEGWKIALNITEFIGCRDLREFAKAASLQGVPGLLTTGVIMADPLEVGYRPPTYKKPLVAQRFHGFFENTHFTKLLPKSSRSRLFHSFPDGAYMPGRHVTKHQNVANVRGLMLQWFAFSPWTRETIARKLQIQKRIPQSEKDLHCGFHHLVTEEDLQDVLAVEAAKCIDLRTSDFYREIYDFPLP